MWSLKSLIEHADTTHANIDGNWVSARPMTGPLWWRIKDAWAVLTGRADAVRWPGGQ